MFHRPRPWLAGVVILGLLPAAIAAQERSRSVSFQSATLGREVRFQVLLPASYDSATAYPVLWLLHGIGGDDSSFLRRPFLERYTARYPMVVVMPSAPRSFFVNSALAEHADYETFITQELHAFVTRHFGVDTLREGVAGASMGGYGAAVLALRYPARYRFAGLLIPALSVPDSIQAADSAFAPWAIPFVDTAFGAPPNAHRAAHDPFLLLRQGGGASAPYFYVTAAEGDEFPSFLPMTREWVALLRTVGAPYEYHEVPGAHDETTVDRALALLLARAWVVLTRLPQGDP